MQTWTTVSTHRLREVWKCPECGEEKHCSLYAGGGHQDYICPECDSEMEFEEHQVRTD